MASKFSPSFSLRRAHQGNRNEHFNDQAVKSTADDAILAKLSSVEKGYYDDPFIAAMARGASGLVNKSNNIRQSRQHHNHRHETASSTAPLIRRGTHARVKAIDRAIDSFLSLPLQKDGSSAPKVDRQVVVLGAGRDTTYLRRRFQKDETTLDSVRWYEVDHPSVMIQKAHSWLPGCIPDGCGCKCEVNDDIDTSYAVILSNKKGDTNSDQSDIESTSNYHLIGHDLRSPPTTLFDKLSHPKHGYDRSLPTLFVLECVMMYLPEDASRDLLRHIAESPVPPLSCCGSSSDTFVSVAMYDPIPSDDRFGQLMIENLQRAGIMGRSQKGHQRSVDNESNRPQLSLEHTLTLSDQLTKLTKAGFDIGAGCNMMNAYNYGVISANDRRRAARCEMLDELEEFVLLMEHYCLIIGVCCSKDREDGGDPSNNKSIGLQLCSIGENSLMGFQDGYCMEVT